MKYFLFIGVLIYMFLSTSVAAKIGIIQVGTFSSLILVILFFHKFFTDTKNKLFSVFKAEFHIILSGIFIILIKIVLAQVEQINMVIFFIIFPMFVSILLGSQSNSNRKIIQNLILFFFILECSLAIYERITLTNMFINLKNEEIYSVEDWGFRSTSFLGNPLNNALCVSLIMGFILSSKLKLSHKSLYLIIGFFSLLCFNARAAILIWMFLLIIYAIKILIDKKTKIKVKVLFSVLFALLIFSIYTLILDYSIGGRVVKSEILDGSAQARLSVMDAFKYINRNDLLFGDANNYLIVMNKLAAGGVENSYIVFIIQYGILMTLILIILYYKLISRFLKHYSLYNKFILLCSFLLLGSANNGLVSSTPWVFFILCFYSFTKFDVNMKSYLKQIRFKYYLNSFLKQKIQY